MSAFFFQGEVEQPPRTCRRAEQAENQRVHQTSTVESAAMAELQPEKVCRNRQLCRPILFENDFIPVFLTNHMIVFLFIFQGKPIKRRDSCFFFRDGSKNARANETHCKVWTTNSGLIFLFVFINSVKVN